MKHGAKKHNQEFDIKLEDIEMMLEDTEFATQTSNIIIEFFGLDALAKEVINS